MNNKIVIITGSPRRRGNCSRLAASFEKRLNELGCETAVYNACSFSACDWSGSGAYFNDADRSDDSEAYLELLKKDIGEAHGVVLAVPVYVYGMPAQVLAMLDKIASAVKSGEISGRKRCALISCCAQKKISVFNGIKFTYEHVVKALGWENSGELLLTSLWKRSDADKHGAADEAYAFADKFAAQDAEEKKMPGDTEGPVNSGLTVSSLINDTLPSWLFE